MNKTALIADIQRAAQLLRNNAEQWGSRNNGEQWGSGNNGGQTPIDFKIKSAGNNGGQTPIDFKIKSA